VESRKKNSEKKISSSSNYALFDPFLPETLDKTYYKVSRSIPNLRIIEDNLEGLYNYFSTPTIRYKIFHPLFIFLKFNKGVHFLVTKELKSVYDL